MTIDELQSDTDGVSSVFQVTTRIFENGGFFYFYFVPNDTINIDVGGLVKTVQAAVQRHGRSGEENRTDIGKRRELFEKPSAGVGKRSETNIEYVHDKTSRKPRRGFPHIINAAAVFMYLSFYSKLYVVVLFTVDAV